MSKLHLLAAITLLSLSLSANSMAQPCGVQDSTHIQGNNTFLLHKSKVYNTYDILDPITNEKVRTKILPIYLPVTVNGVTIEQEKAPYDVGTKLQNTIATQVKERIESIKMRDEGDVIVMLRHVVVDEKGNIVYAEFGYDMYHGVDKMWRVFAAGITNKMLEDALKPLHWSSANKYTMLHTDLEKVKFRVKAGKVSVVPAY
jgi:hypothetical protein